MSEKVGTKSEKSYTVQGGDTLDSIARRHGLTRTELLKANTKIKNPNLLKPKDILIIPGKKTIINKTKEATGKIKTEMDEKAWEQKIIANLEEGKLLQTQLGTFDLRKKFIPGEASNIQVIKQAFNSYMKVSGKGLSEQQKKHLLAYIIATAKHETAGFTTLKEKTNGERYNPPNKVAKVLGNESGEGPTYIGRGYVQITGENNYQKWSEKIFGTGNATILTKYRSVLLLNPDISSMILVKGMMEGSFTGKSLKSYLGKDALDFGNARRTVNGIDKATKIAEYAREYLKKI